MRLQACHRTIHCTALPPVWGVGATAKVSGWTAHGDGAALDASRPESIIGGTMKTKGIHSDPSVRMGKPVIAGTRLTIARILEQLAAGETNEQIREAHPRWTRKAGLAAFADAAEARRKPPPEEAAGTA